MVHNFIREIFQLLPHVIRRNDFVFPFFWAFDFNRSTVRCKRSSLNLIFNWNHCPLAMYRCTKEMLVWCLKSSTSEKEEMFERWYWIYEKRFQWKANIQMVFSCHKIHALLQLETGYYPACDTLRASCPCALCIVDPFVIGNKTQSNEIGRMKMWKICAHIVANKHKNRRWGKRRERKRGKEGNSTWQKPLLAIMFGRDSQTNDGAVVCFSHTFSRNSIVMMPLLMYSKRHT